MMFPLILKRRQRAEVLTSRSTARSSARTHSKSRRSSSTFVRKGITRRARPSGRAAPTDFGPDRRRHANVIRRTKS